MFLMNFRLYMLGRKLATANKNLETAMEEKFLADTSRSHSIKPTVTQEAHVLDRFYLESMVLRASRSRIPNVLHRAVGRHRRYGKPYVAGVIGV